MAKYTPHRVNMAAPQENFAEMYSFDKKNKPSPRESLNGVTKWDKKWRGECGESMRPKEDAFLEGKPSAFKGTKKDGRLRTNGGYRIGKR